GATAREEDTGDDAPSGFTEIEASDVRFRYPGSETEALKGVDIRLRAGEVVALVGENGSGKTTLAKLLAGLYEPDAGAIAWDGRQISEFRPSSLRERITVVFQDFVRYALPARENITVGRVDQPTDEVRLRQSAAAAGATSA